MQVDFNAINAVTKEITITVASEEVSKAWDKYLSKAARKLEVAGFRKGKAPLKLIERVHGDSLQERFLQDRVSDYFTKASEEHEIKYLLFPDVKDVDWEKGSDMIIKIEIEHEPALDFKQLDNLDVPHNPILLDDEVNKYLEELKQQSGVVIDVEKAEPTDLVEVELTLKLPDEDIVKNASFFAGEEPARRALPELIGKGIGDTLETELEGTNIKLVCQDSNVNIDNEESYPVKLMVNSISRMQLPELNDDFAKDMEFDSMQAMRAKIADDMRLANQHKNIDAKNYYIVGKLFEDNQFELPMKTIEYLAHEEAQKYGDSPQLMYIEYQLRMKISQELVEMYILSNLRNKIEITVTDEMRQEYLTHRAILEDHTVEAFKEKYKDEIAAGDFEIGVKNYFILRKLAETANFFVQEPEAEEQEIPEAEIESVEEEQPQAEAAESRPEEAKPEE
ncbi:MAG: trigger factor [Candidatus Cloacimonetes bacterium]|nr:trigger factor [Candidatus Cloacimonadota bacterium]